MQVTVTDFKTSASGEKVTVDTDKVISIYSGVGVFDGRSREGWNVVMRKDDTDYYTIFLNNDDVKLLRTVK